MMPWPIAWVLVLLLAGPASAGEAESFDPDQPFVQGLSGRLLESFLAQALEVVRDHVDISGSLNPDAPADEPQGLRFKFYPEGKSKSGEHLSAEGWFGPSQDARRREFHFRFSVPHPSGEGPSELPGNVL